MVEPALLTAAELGQAYAAGELSPVEATQAALDRIDAYDKAVNAFCLVDPERALASLASPSGAGSEVSRSGRSTGYPPRSRTCCPRRGGRRCEDRG